MGLLPEVAGSVRFAGRRDWRSGRRTALHSWAGLCARGASYLPTLTVAENLEVGRLPVRAWQPTRHLLER